ncbi:unnamed protein product [Rangifer tarandus platyrhynchus]|uniref:Uncharacterized protein n=1 Tax=Rangifer tarandus platyrhynchus TaxID=3082113 RepID=A0AC59ZXX7_RANTA
MGDTRPSQLAPGTVQKLYNCWGRQAAQCPVSTGNGQVSGEADPKGSEKEGAVPLRAQESASSKKVPGWPHGGPPWSLRCSQAKSQRGEGGATSVFSIFLSVFLSVHFRQAATATLPT